MWAIDQLPTDACPRLYPCYDCTAVGAPTVLAICFNISTWLMSKMVRYCAASTGFWLTVSWLSCACSPLIDQFVLPLTTHRLSTINTLRWLIACFALCPTAILEPNALSYQCASNAFSSPPPACDLSSDIWNRMFGSLALANNALSMSSSSLPYMLSTRD